MRQIRVMAKAMKSRSKPKRVTAKPVGKAVSDFVGSSGVRLNADELAVIAA